MKQLTAKFYFQIRNEYRFPSALNFKITQKTFFFFFNFLSSVKPFWEPLISKKLMRIFLRFYTKMHIFSMQKNSNSPERKFFSSLIDKTILGTPEDRKKSIWIRFSISIRCIHFSRQMKFKVTRKRIFLKNLSLRLMCSHFRNPWRTKNVINSVLTSNRTIHVV